MPLTRLDNLISSKTGKYLYVSPDDFNATDALSNRGNSPVTPFKSIQRAFLEIARYSYLPGPDNDRFDQFSIMLMPGIHYIDNRPGLGDTANIAEFGFANNAWTDNSILDISNPDNVLYKFNNTEGGAIIPRGSSLVGYDLRRTVIRPLYVPDPASVTVPRSAIFNVTGGCYFWQFTIKDGQTTSESPLYNANAGTGEVYYDPTDFTKKAAPNYSHHKLTVFEYADTEELSLFYRKIAKAFKQYQPSIFLPGEFDFNVQENRIVGPLSDSRVIESLGFDDATTDPSIPASTSEITVTTKVDHGYFAGQFVAISGTEIDSVLEGFFPIKEIDPNDPRKFIYEVPVVVSAIGTGIASQDVLSVETPVALGQNAQTLAEVDSVESASPYVFNCSIRSTWGICGIWANGLKATGFKSMVIAQYTGVSLQRDDRAFIRYDEYSNTWNQASLSDAFATVPYHAKGDSYWKDDWRNFHVRASEDAFIQNVSIFAVGFADHFLMESGGDMSITNSNSNFGNTSLHAIGFKGFAFNQDKAGYITDIIPPEQVVSNSFNVEKTNYYTVDIEGTTKDPSNFTKLFLGSEEILTPRNRPAVSINGYRLGAKSGDKLYVKLDKVTGSGEVFNATLSNTGFVKYIAKGSVLNPSGIAVNNVYADAANLIESNRRMMQEEVFGYILEKYPRLQNISYVNPGLNPNANRYFDARNLILANRQEIVDESHASMLVTYPSATVDKDSIGEFVDAIAEDLRDGGNSNTISQVEAYFNSTGTLASFVGQEDEAVWAFNRARDLCKKAIANLLTVKADIYDKGTPDGSGGWNSIFFTGNVNNYPTFIAGKGYTGSEAEDANLTTNGVTYDPAGVTDPAGRYKDARNRIIANREFILDGALAEIAVYHPDFYIPGDTQSNSQSRFADGFRLIRRNSKEIADKALAAIALNHPDFYFPGDAQTDTGSRFADSYRLIQQNKTEIVNAAFDYMNANNPPASLPANYESKCKRDLGYFVDAISLDVFLGANEYSYRFAAEYFDANGAPLTNGLTGEISSSITAFTEAVAQMKLAITNQLGVSDLTITADPLTGSNTDPASCANVQSAMDTLLGLITTILNDGNLSSLPAEINKGTLVNGELKCYRDINYFIDAISVDMFVGGNKHTRTFVQQYFSNTTTQLPNGLIGEEAESVTAFDAASLVMQQAVRNALYYKDLTVTPGESEYGDGNGVVPNDDPTACADVASAISNLVSIVTDVFQGQPNPTLALLPAENPGTLLAGETKCRRDIGHIVDAVAQDLWFGGNEYTIAATKEYFDNNSLILNGVDNEVGPSVTAFRRAQDLMNRAVNNQYYNRDLTITLDQTGDPPVFSDTHSNAYLQVLENKEFIAKEAYERMKAAYPTYTPQTGNTEQDCLDDVYNVLAEVMYDVKFGGNAKTYDSANVYVTNEFSPAGYNLAYPANPVVGRTESDPNATPDTLGFYTENGPRGEITWAWDGTAWKVETFIDAERDEAARVFTEVKSIATQIIRSETVSVSPGNPLTQIIDNTITDDWDADENLPKCASAVATTDTLLDIIIQAIGTDAGVGNLNGITRTVPAQPTTYAVGNCSDVLGTIDTLISIVCDNLDAGNLNDLPVLDNGNWDCANVRSSIETLFDILTDAIDGNTLNNLPVVNTGDFTVNNEASKCFRDVSYVVDALVNDLRLGGNINSIQVGEAYYVGTNLDYIDGEKSETLDAWNYVGNLATAAMRNFDFLAYNCTTTSGSAIVDVNDTSGIVIGMKVEEYSNTSYTYGTLNAGSTPIYTTIPEGTYVKQILSNTTIELGVENSRLGEGIAVNALLSSTTINLHFKLEKGAWADTLPKTKIVGAATDPTTEVVWDTTTSASSAECASTAAAINTLINALTTVIDVGPGSVTRQEQTVTTALLASRATLFTIDTTGAGGNNPHQFETGTPVRLAPRPRFDNVTGKYVDVDKRLVRLPNGFETNRTYYVIAPGRKTIEGGKEYNTTTVFNGSAASQNKLMLATSPENAAAGIYIYSSETDTIDPNVEIDIYQFVRDISYDCHTYTVNLTNATSGGIETNIAHIFDIPASNVTPQKVFFRALEGSNLPLLGTGWDTSASIAVTDTNDPNFGRIDPQKEVYVRYQSNKVFTIHESAGDALANQRPILFQSGQNNLKFEVFANKRISPVKFDPTFGDTGKWYVECIDEVTPNNGVNINNILWRIQQSDYSDRPKTTDTWFERLTDRRDKDDRTYKLRYVIPKYLENARDPINGFVLKTRTDDTRKLVPQKILLKPVTGSVYGARFENPRQSGEFIGYTAADFEAQNLNLAFAYDPYGKDLSGSGTEYRAFAKFASGIQATIQSGRYVEDEFDSSIKYLELTVYDHAVDTLNYPGLRNELFTTVKIESPQGGSFVANKTQNIASNEVQFSGNSSGTANIHAYMNVGGDHYLIIKNIRGGKLEFSEYTATEFRQGNVFATMLEDQDMGKSLPLKTLIRKNYPEYYYKQNGANIYTITPGDRVTDGAGVEYYVDKVEDVGVIEDTFYIFDSQELQKRISGQQDGIYYLTALRGNVSPFPQGAGVAENFKKYKFSQPVGKLYPLNYRNDPLWFQNNGTSIEEKNYYSQLIDPPSAFSAADNYIHGLVTVNDVKNSTTREMVEDLTQQPAFVENEYTNTTSDSVGNVIDNRIRAQEGNAASGSEDRRIPIAGDGQIISKERYYVELRRPSIARAGNHTFEYLGFGPGNYSTGLPARQEIVLEFIEDFYAQSKKQDAGIVFYTGINSQGDLYIGNRRINAITGEETFIDKAVLEDDGDDEDVIAGLVTTFDTPVTFNEYINVIGGDGDLVNTFESPILITVQDEDLTNQKDSLIIRSNVSSIDPVTQLQQDEILDRLGWATSSPLDGDIRLGKNRIDAAIFAFNSRGNGQKYKIQTHYAAGGPSNLSPNQSGLSSVGGNAIVSDQVISYQGVIPDQGDILLKGGEIGKSGSLGWILTNFFTRINNDNISTITTDGSNVIKITFLDINTNLPQTLDSLGITAGSRIRFKYYPDANFNLPTGWTIYSPTNDPFDINDNYLYIQIANPKAASVSSWATLVSNNTPSPTLEFSNSIWKETGVIGAEALRTDTTAFADFKLGINTISRASHDSVYNAFVEQNSTNASNQVQGTEPVANLDVCGTTFISGRTFIEPSFLAVSDGYTRYGNSLKQDNALIVGSGTPGDLGALSVLRVSTTAGPLGGENGRIGINTTAAEMNGIFSTYDIAMRGKTFNSGDLTISGRLDIFTGALDTTSTSVDLMNTPTTVRFAMAAETLEIANASGNTASNTINIANYASQSQFALGNVATTTSFNIHRASRQAEVRIATVANNNDTYDCNITLGGAFLNSGSMTEIKTRNTNLDGDVQIGSGITAGSGTGKLFSLNSSFELLAASGGPNTVDFATSASTLNMGSQGGTTRVRNALRVNARADFDGDIELHGGVNAGGFEVVRNVFGTTSINHPAGSLADFNVDLYKRVNISDKELDAFGAAQISATEEYIGFNEVVTAGEISIGDFLLLDQSATDEDQSEIVRVIELTNLTDQTPGGGGIRVRVERGAEGTTARIHPDNTPIFRLDKSDNASYLTTGINTTITQVQTAEFGGSIVANDYLRISDSEFVRVVSVLTALTSIQGLRINDGAEPTSTKTFEVLSTTGNTFILGELEVNKTILLKGSTTAGTEYLRVTNGTTAATVAFEVDSANGDTKIRGDLSVGAGFNKFLVDGSTGDTVINGGDFTIKDAVGTNNKLRLENTSGNLTIAGLFVSEATSGTSSFASDLQVNGGDFAVRNGTTDIFKVSNNSTIKLGGIDYYYGPTGAKRWDYLSQSSGGADVVSNINYFVNVTGDLYIRLPESPKHGDLIRFVDIGGELSYNLKLVIRAANGQRIQGDNTNIAPTVSGVNLSNHNGGELNVTTPNAAFGLIYAGDLNSDGTSSGVPSSKRGWWLVEI